MNQYEIRVNGATIRIEGHNEYTAIRNTFLFDDIEMVEAVRTYDDPTKNFGWIYQATVNGRTAIIYIKRI